MERLRVTVEQWPMLIRARQMAGVLALALAIGSSVVGADAQHPNADEGVAGLSNPAGEQTGVARMIESAWEAPPAPGRPGEPY